MGLAWFAVHRSSRMAPRRRSSPDGANGRQDWLADGEHGRTRAWAYEEILFGSDEERARAKELERVVDEIEVERRELARLHEELDAHLGRVALRDRRLEELTTPSDSAPRAAPLRRTLPSAPEDLDDCGEDRPYDRRSRLLAHCEGFDVDSPVGPVGFVEGVRFVTRIDCPDVLEVRGGRFGRQLILVPVEDVEEILLPERVVLLRTTPDLSKDLLDDLGERVRHALHLDRTAS